MRYIFTFLFLYSFLYSQTLSDIIYKHQNDIKQKEIMEGLYKDNKRDTIEYKYNIEDKNSSDIVENRIFLNNIDILGSTVFSKKQLQKVLQTYINKNNTIEDIKSLKEEITNLYIKNGYITSFAYIKPQDLGDGNLEIDILEGKIENIVVSNINLINLFKSKENRVLNIKELEILLQQAQRLYSQKLDIKILPSNNPSYSVVSISNIRGKKLYNGTFGINNFGYSKTGKYQIYNNTNIENLNNLSDILSININTTDRGLRTNNKVLGTNLSYEIPYERALFTLRYNYSNYKQNYNDIFYNSYQIDGNNKSYALDLEYKLYHNLNHYVDLKANFEHKKTKNYFEDVKLDLQSYNTSSVSSAIKYAYNTYNTSFFTQLQYTKGVGGSVDDILTQKLYYQKSSLDIGYSYYFDRSNNLRYNLYARGEYSKDNLLSLEEISIGGIYSVRGYEKIGLTGNKGYFVRNELLAIYHLNNITSSPYIALDYGYVHENQDSFGGEIIGGALGVKFNYKDIGLDLFCSNPLKSTKDIKDNNKTFVGFNLTYYY